MITAVSLVINLQPSSDINTIKGEKRKRKHNFFLLMRILRVFSLSNFHIYCTVALVVVIMLDISSLVLTYNWMFLSFNHYSPIPPPPPLTSGNHTYDSFF